MMQFHFDGYVVGDPRIQPAAGVGATRADELPDEVDVLVVGAGPAGMITAAQLSQYPGVVTRIIERAPGPLEIGRADGIQPRSVETFQAFGFAGRLIEEAYQEKEMVFWRPDPSDPSRIVRCERTPDDPGHVSEFPHLLVNEARVLAYFAQFMANAPTRMRPDYGYEFRTLSIAPRGEHPVSVSLRRSAGPEAGSERRIRARYVVGCDGASSDVRAAIGGRLTGSDALHAWGVMDVLAVTDFPDIRMKCAIQSHDGGNILHIPREGGYLFRMYVDLGDVVESDRHAVRDTSLEEIIARANTILHPYTLDVKHVAWHSVYEVAHRITDRFDDVSAEQAGQRAPHVFLAGDACHTHSAKAGQGMNVSMQDGFNLAWKLGSVLSGRSPQALLSTYSDERRVIAKDLIDFDREWSTLMARNVEEFQDRAELADYYLRTWEFPAGFMTEYRQSTIVAGQQHQAFASGYPVGKRFRSEPVIRVADATPLQLGHLHRADGRWRLYAFADADCGARSTLTAWADWMLNDVTSPVRRYTPHDSPIDTLFDIKVVYPQRHSEVDINAAPPLFFPRRGPFELIDYEKVYAVDPEHDIFELRGISREAGCVVVVRPDQYVAAVLPLDACTELRAFFEGLMLEPNGNVRERATTPVASQARPVVSPTVSGARPAVSQVGGML